MKRSNFRRAMKRKRQKALENLLKGKPEPEGSARSEEQRQQEIKTLQERIA